MDGMPPVFRENFPSRLLSCEVKDLHAELKGPALFHLPGAKEPALLVSALLHGNEHTGFLALKEWLRPYAQGTKPLPRSLWIFIGNTAAAEKNLRHLSGQTDFNRVWRDYAAPDGAFAREVLEKVTSKPLFACVDIHNNSGRNPHYACVARWERHHLQLASLFGRTVVHAEQPLVTFTHSFSDHCPAVTLECGISGEPRGTQHVKEFLDACLHLNDFASHSLSPRDIDGFQTVARVMVRPGVKFTFSQEDASADLYLRSDLDTLNFSELPAGTLLGTYRGSTPPLIVENSAGVDPGLLLFEKGTVKTARVVSPAMFTLSPRAILEDCVGYLMIHKPLSFELP